MLPEVKQCLEDYLDEVGDRDLINLSIRELMVNAFEAGYLKARELYDVRTEAS